MTTFKTLSLHAIMCTHTHNLDAQCAHVRNVHTLHVFRYMQLSRQSCSTQQSLHYTVCTSDAHMHSHVHTHMRIHRYCTHTHTHTHTRAHTITELTRSTPGCPSSTSGMNLPPSCTQEQSSPSCHTIRYTHSYQTQTTYTHTHTHTHTHTNKQTW